MEFIHKIDLSTRQTAQHTTAKYDDCIAKYITLMRLTEQDTAHSTLRIECSAIMQCIQLFVTLAENKNKNMLALTTKAKPTHAHTGKIEEERKKQQQSNIVDCPIRYITH